MMKGCYIQIKQSKKHKLIITGDTNLQIVADESRISQVVENLVNNAVEYAADSDVICIHVEKSGDDAKIKFTDKGPGIAADKIPNLFTRYYRADYSGSSYPGLGPGLYIIFNNFHAMAISPGHVPHSAV